mmetsp:Transcript_16152/g.17954  ORF Transcript_16152/g.17954 Transcript_16152/m.17954 type:complete len:190 (-) Transcript_16152:246-815(-)
MVPHDILALLWIDVRIGIPQGEDLFRAGGTPGEAGNESLQILVRIVHHVPEELEGDQFSDGHFAVVDEQSAEIQDHHTRTQIEIPGEGGSDGVAPRILDAAAERFVVGVGIFGPDRFFATEGLDRPYVRQCLRRHAVAFGPMRQHFTGQSLAPLCVSFPQVRYRSHGDEGEHGETIGLNETHYEASDEY